MGLGILATCAGYLGAVFGFGFGFCQAAGCAGRTSSCLVCLFVYLLGTCLQVFRRAVTASIIWISFAETDVSMFGSMGLGCTLGTILWPKNLSLFSLSLSPDVVHSVRTAALQYLRPRRYTFFDHVR